MAEREVFSGFPEGEIIYRSSDEDWMERVHDIAGHLAESLPDTVPATTYERYELYLSVPDTEGKQDVALSWPMSDGQYDTFWHPTVEEPAALDTGATATTDPLAIFRPAQRIDDDPDFEAERMNRDKLARDALAKRLGVASTVLEEVPQDPFIQMYIDSHGVFDRAKGGSIPLGFNFDGIDRNIYYRAADGLEPFFSTRRMTRMSQGRIDTVTGQHTSLSDGSVYHSDEQPAEWQASLRADLGYLLDRLKTVPQYYLDLFDERGYFFQDESGTARQIGTAATREFFRGYYQFAPGGITLLKARCRNNLYGEIDYDGNSGVRLISTVYAALKRDLAARPHLVRLQAISSDEPGESYAELKVYGYPHSLDGVMLNNRIGGYYGDLTDEPEAIVGRMGETLRQQIGPAILDIIMEGQPVGTEFRGFSHHDFYAVVEYLSRVALSDTDQ